VIGDRLLQLTICETELLEIEEDFNVEWAVACLDKMVTGDMQREARK